ncbi:hypothetical protein E2C01_002753 [Portunus trituberculatus]|uniref:Uncharacterized protein n=1 Tax=Portunus trituberculatus TaxID=210409 RepID=A0A5B7CNC3_PORTR|nr:hypothetical protein [Portunus trituberculatus]
MRLPLHLCLCLLVTPLAGEETRYETFTPGRPPSSHFNEAHPLPATSTTPTIPSILKDSFYEFLHLTPAILTLSATNT